MIKRLSGLAVLCLILMTILFTDDVRNSITYQLHGSAAFSLIVKEVIGIIKCPRVFRDGSCAGEWHTEWTKPNESK